MDHSETIVADFFFYLIEFHGVYTMSQNIPEHIHEVPLRECEYDVRTAGSNSAKF